MALATSMTENANDAHVWGGSSNEDAATARRDRLSLSHRPTIPRNSQPNDYCRESDAGQGVRGANPEPILPNRYLSNRRSLTADRDKRRFSSSFAGDAVALRQAVSGPWRALLSPPSGARERALE